MCNDIENELNDLKEKYEELEKECQKYKQIINKLMNSKRPKLVCNENDKYFEHYSKLSAYNMKLKDYLNKHNISTSKFDDDAEVGYFIPYKYLFNNPKKYAVFMFICEKYLDGKSLTGKKIFNELGFNYKYSSSILKDLQEKDFIVRVPVSAGIKNIPSEYGMKIYKDIEGVE